jgi:hypothetical protein
MVFSMTNTKGRLMPAPRYYLFRVKAEATRPQMSCEQPAASRGYAHPDVVPQFEHL